MEIKKTILTLASLAMATFTFAQSAGQIAVGTDLLIASETGTQTSHSVTVDTNKETAFVFTPNISYFVNDIFAVGAGISYGATSEVTDFTAGSNNNIKLYDKNSTLGFNVFARSYIQVAKYLYYTPSVGLNISSTTYNSESLGVNDVVSTATSNNSRTSLGLNLVSFEYKPCEAIGLGLTYGGTNFNVFNDNISVSFRYYL